MSTYFWKIPKKMIAKSNFVCYTNLTRLANASKQEVKNMKRYKVYVYNTVDKFWDCYDVNAIDPVDARNVAVQRLIDETGHGLDVYEVTDVCAIKD